MTGRQAVVKALYESPTPVAIHQLDVPGVSQATVSARLRELRKDGIAQKMKAPGSKFDLWRLTPADLILPLVVHPSKAGRMNDTQRATK